MHCIVSSMEMLWYQAASHAEDDCAANADDCRSSEAADILADLGAHSETDVALQMQRLTLDIVGDVAFSYDFGQTRQMER